MIIYSGRAPKGQNRDIYIQNKIVKGDWASHFTSSNGNIFRVTGPLCGNSPLTGEFPSQMTVTRSFGVFCDLRLNKRLSKQSWGWWFETSSRSLWRHGNDSSRSDYAEWITEHNFKNYFRYASCYTIPVVINLAKVDQNPNYESSLFYGVPFQ